MHPYVPGTKSGVSLGAITQMTEAVQMKQNQLNHGGNSFGQSHSSVEHERARQALEAPVSRQYIQADYKKQLEPQTMMSSTTTIGASGQPALTAQQHEIMSDSRRGVYQKIYSLQQ